MKSLIMILVAFMVLNESCSNKKNIHSNNVKNDDFLASENTANQVNNSVNILYNIWGLKEMNSISIDADNGMMLEINTKEMFFMGFASCNKIFGSIASEKENEISFFNIGTTRKLCSEMDNENNFIKTLKKAKSFKVKSLHLLVFDETDNLLFDFIKMD